MDFSQFLKDLASMFNDMIVPRLAPVGANFEEMTISGYPIWPDHVHIEWQDGASKCWDRITIGSWWRDAIHN